jgi:hypothetical protein
MEKIETLWSKVQNIPYIFDDFTRGRKDLFVELFLKRDTVAYEIGEHGLLYFTEVNPPINACVHIVFWDRKFKDRVEPVRNIIKTLITDYDIHRVSALIPTFNRAAILFGKRVGFKVEGVLREVTFSLGKWHDAAILGALRRDLDGEYSQRLVRNEVQGT